MVDTINISDTPLARQQRWVIMGVCGCGKSEIGQRLAQQLNVRFVEGDAYHTTANVAKMAAGIPLDDRDRAEWLQCLKSELASAKSDNAGLVLSCSALKRAYRDLLREADADLFFVHLHGDRQLIAQRMQARGNHFMPTSLLDSQLLALQLLDTDEQGIQLDINPAPDVLITQILSA
ncbi:gluconokinase [Undibacterium sp. SXout7W]|uniref:gluconokinase n=1 Tax=Undibacterium sp. SXout7W TaxID=3413049 RepID=UPI003BF074A9